MNTFKFKGETYHIYCGGVYTAHRKNYEQKWHPDIDHQWDKMPDGYMIDLCEKWINRFAIPRKSVNTRHSSYGLKHVVERTYRTYIYNGAFIQAALNLGHIPVPHGEFHKDINTWFRLGYDKNALGVQ